MMIFFFLFVGLMFPLVAKLIWKTEIKLIEMVIHFLVVIFFSSLLFYGGSYYQTQDTMLIAGEVVNKEKNRVHCRHSYPCRCRTTCSGGKTRTCSTICDTCYHHPFDIDWDVKAKLVDGTSDRTTIDTIDSQGLKMPPRWEKVAIGDPYTTTRSFTNYLKNIDSNILQKDKVKYEAYKNKIPLYPKVFDYYNTKRVFVDGKPNNKLSSELDNVLKLVGKKDTANIIVLVVNDLPREYKQAIEAEWKGGKLNDTILIVGVTDNKIMWSDTVAYNGNKGNELLAIEVRDIALKHGVVDKELIQKVGEVVKNRFDIMSTEDLEYMKDSIDPPTWLVTLSIILSLLLSFGCTWFFVKHDIN